MILIVTASALAFGSVGAAIALRSGSASVVQGMFPLVFVILFLSSAFFPQNLLLEPASTIAEYNPASFIVDAVRDPVISTFSSERHVEGGRGDPHRRRDRLDPLGAGPAAKAADGLMSAVPITHDLQTIGAMMRRSANELIRVPGAAIPGVLAPTIFFLGLTAAFGNLTELRGFDTDSYQSFLIPVSMLQGAGFTGAAAGVNLARDIEIGLFDRFLASPGARAGCCSPGLVLLRERALADPGDRPARRRARDRGELPGHARPRSSRSSSSCGWRSSPPAGESTLALRFKTQAAAPLMQAVMLALILCTTAYAPQELLTGWLYTVAEINPITQVVEAARQGFIGEVTWAGTWPALVALAGFTLVLGAFALRGMRRTAY